MLFLNKTHPFSFEGEERGEMAHCVFYDFFCLYSCALGINWYYEYVQQLIHRGVSRGVSTVSYVGRDSVALVCMGFGGDLASS